MGLTKYRVQKMGIDPAHLDKLEAGGILHLKPETIEKYVRVFETNSPTLMEKMGYISKEHAELLIGFDKLSKPDRKKALAFIKKRDF